MLRWYCKCDTNSVGWAPVQSQLPLTQPHHTRTGPGLPQHEHRYTIRRAFRFHLRALGMSVDALDKERAEESDSEWEDDSAEDEADSDEVQDAVTRILSSRSWFMLMCMCLVLLQRRREGSCGARQPSTRMCLAFHPQLQQ